MKIFQSDFFQDDSQVYPSIQTSTTLTQPPSEELISSQVDSPVNRSVRPESREARRMTVGSGRKCSELLSKHNPLGSLLKTLLASSTWHSTRCYLTWKPKTTPRQRLYFQLAVKMPSTAETESGSLQNTSPMWATPNTMDGMNPRTGEALEKNLFRGDHANPKARRRSRSGNLREQVIHPQMWPTPRSSEHKDCGPVGSKSHTHMLDRKYLCAATKESDRPTGKLNPQWVEWLMGYPIGWTDLKD